MTPARLETLRATATPVRRAGLPDLLVEELVRDNPILVGEQSDRDAVGCLTHGQGTVPQTRMVILFWSEPQSEPLVRSEGRAEVVDSDEQRVGALIEHARIAMPTTIACNNTEHPGLGRRPTDGRANWAQNCSAG
jgi:hypothetical protein